jgi:putative Mg2+ transporter-C (MgtC) family protein
MSTTGLGWAQIVQPFTLDRLQQFALTNGAIGRLLLACLLGGFIGLEREAKGKPSGVRTNLLICMGASFFTLLSAVLAGDANPDKGRVASNIVQGIGFLGAGLILHNRSRVSGLTSAATVWVVASIGTACGVGLYITASMAAVLVVITLELVGFLERRANIKKYSVIYEARGSDKTQVLRSILNSMDKVGERLKNFDEDAVGDLKRVTFSLTANKKGHERLSLNLKTETAIDELLIFDDPEED